MRTKAKNIDEYIAAFPHDVGEILEKIRMTIRKAAPDAEETISYQIPAFKLNGPVIYFAAFKAHIGVYPITATIKAKFRKELSRYELGKGTVRFPLEQPVPYDLIGKIAKFKLKENLQRAEAKAKKKTGRKN